jgi:hypothetical protein
VKGVSVFLLFSDFFIFQIYILTKDEGGLAQPLAKEKMVLCFSKTWDCSAFVDLTGEDEKIAWTESGLGSTQSYFGLR